MTKHIRSLEELKNSTLIPVMLVPERIPVSIATVRAWIFQGKLPVVRIGRLVFIRKEVLEKIEMGGFEAISGEHISCPPLLLFKGVIVTKVIECKSSYPIMLIKNGQIRTKK
jgi:hypothetical protein